MAKGPFSICFVDRGKLQFFSGGSVATFKFDQAVVRDIEVVNKDTFRKQLVTFVVSQKISSSHFVIIFSENICFSLDINLKLTEEEKRSVITNFKNSVPFEHVDAKVFSLSTGERLVCVNKDLYEAIIQALDLRGFTCLDVYPDYVIGNLGAKSGLTAENAKVMAENASREGSRGFFGNMVIEPEPQTLMEKESFWTKNKRMIILVSIFGLLVLVLLIFVLTR